MLTTAVKVSTKAEEHSKSPNKTPGQPEDIENNLKIDLPVSGERNNKNSKA